jgi:hypothetical protein
MALVSRSMAVGNVPPSMQGGYQPLGDEDAGRSPTRLESLGRGRAGVELWVAGGDYDRLGRRQDRDVLPAVAAGKRAVPTSRARAAPSRWVAPLS